LDLRPTYSGSDSYFRKKKFALMCYQFKQDPNFLAKYAGAFKLAAYAADGPLSNLI